MLLTSGAFAPPNNSQQSVTSLLVFQTASMQFVRFWSSSWHMRSFLLQFGTQMIFAPRYLSWLLLVGSKTWYCNGKWLHLCFVFIQEHFTISLSLFLIPSSKVLAFWPLLRHSETAIPAIRGQPSQHFRFSGRDFTVKALLQKEFNITCQVWEHAAFRGLSVFCTLYFILW